MLQSKKNTIVNCTRGQHIKCFAIWNISSHFNSFKVVSPPTKVGDDDDYLAMKVIQSWKLSIDESHRRDDLRRFACGDVFFMFGEGKVHN